MTGLPVDRLETMGWLGLLARGYFGITVAAGASATGG
jgi:hypothetical protein